MSTGELRVNHITCRVQSFHIPRDLLAGIVYLLSHHVTTLLIFMTNSSVVNPLNCYVLVCYKALSNRILRTCSRFRVKVGVVSTWRMTLYPCNSFELNIYRNSVSLNCLSVKYLSVINIFLCVFLQTVYTYNYKYDY